LVVAELEEFIMGLLMLSMAQIPYLVQLHLLAVVVALDLQETQAQLEVLAVALAPLSLERLVVAQEILLQLHHHKETTAELQLGALTFLQLVAAVVLEALEKALVGKLEVLEALDKHLQSPEHQ
jgi:hypothetical protein